MKLADFRGQLEDASVSAHAQIKVSSPYPFSGMATTEELDLAILKKLDVLLPLRIQGTVDASVAVKGTALPLDIEGVVDVKAARLRLQGIPTEDLHAKVTYQKGLLHYQLQGNTLGGSVALDGAMSTSEATVDKAPKGELHVKDVQIRRLFQALQLPVPTQAFGGRFNLDFAYEQKAATEWPTGRGHVSVSKLRYQDILLADEISGDLSFADQELRLRNVNSELAQGIVQGEMVLNLKTPARSWFTANLDGVESAYLLGPWVGAKIKGPVQARLRGKLGREWTVTAEMEMAQGQVMGLAVTNWHLPATIRYAQGKDEGKLQSRRRARKGGRAPSPAMPSLAGKTPSTSTAS